MTRFLLRITRRASLFKSSTNNKKDCKKDNFRLSSEVFSTWLYLWIRGFSALKNNVMRREIMLRYRNSSLNSWELLAVKLLPTFEMTIWDINLVVVFNVTTISRTYSTYAKTLTQQVLNSPETKLDSETLANRVRGYALSWTPISLNEDSGFGETWDWTKSRADRDFTSSEEIEVEFRDEKSFLERANLHRGSKQPFYIVQDCFQRKTRRDEISSWRGFHQLTGDSSWIAKRKLIPRAGKFNRGSKQPFYIVQDCFQRKTRRDEIAPWRGFHQLTGDSSWIAKRKLIPRAGNFYRGSNTPCCIVKDCFRWEMRGNKISPWTGF